jgi:hypothetical protein
MGICGMITNVGCDATLANAKGHLIKGSDSQSYIFETSAECPLAWQFLASGPHFFTRERKTMYNIACAIMFASLTYVLMKDTFPDKPDGGDMVVGLVLVMMWISSFLGAILP